MTPHFSFTDIRPELRVFGAIGLVWLFLIIQGRPPVHIKDLRIIESEIVPGSIVNIEATGVWKRQCPSTVYRFWKDTNNNPLFGMSPIPGGAASPSPAEQKNIYKHLLPLKPKDGEWPAEVCFQAVMEHRCGLLDTVSVTPTACAKVVQDLPDGPVRTSQ